MESLSRVTQSDRDYNHYMSRLKYEMDTASQMHSAKEEGKRENIIDTVKRAFGMGLKLDAISQLTQLPVADIEALQKNL
jgi:hypothetical protein